MLLFFHGEQVMWHGTCPCECQHVRSSLPRVEPTEVGGQLRGNRRGTDNCAGKGGKQSRGDVAYRLCRQSDTVDKSGDGGAHSHGSQGSSQLHAALLLQALAALLLDATLQGGVPSVLHRIVRPVHHSQLRLSCAPRHLRREHTNKCGSGMARWGGGAGGWVGGWVGG